MLKYQGFTLIELLVSVTILLLLVGGAMAGFLQFSERREVEEAAKQVQRMAISAQQKAAVRESPTSTGCTTGDNRLIAYRLRKSDNTFILQAVCGDREADVPPTPTTGLTITEVERVVLPSSIATTPTTNNNTDFYTLHGGTSTSADRIYTFSGSSINYQFTVYPGGTVSNVERIP